MRNKHNEGYTLPLVMVVLLVLAIVAVTIMTTSLKNMQRQQGFIETMKAQYAAQGEIEKIVAQLENLGTEATESPMKDPTLTDNYDGEIDKLSGTSGEVESALCTVEIYAKGIEETEINRKKHYTIPDESTVIMVSTCGTVTIQCEMKLSLKGSGNEVIYTSYEIIKGGATG